MKAQFFSAVAVAASAFGAVQAANAQSIDYGSLQQLFNEPVTTSATGAPLRSTEAPVDMTIITAEDIKRSGATDLPTILSRVPGIDILNWGAGDSDVSVRGYNQAFSPRLLVLINGREVYLDNYGYTAWSALPVQLSEIRQIEIVRGPNSALFGFNAVGGVINIITFNPKFDNYNSAEVHGGTQNDVGGSVVQTLHLGDRIGLRLSAGGERQDEWQNAYQYPNVWNAQGMFDGVAQVSRNTELRVQGTWTRSSEMNLNVLDDYVVATYSTSSLMSTLTSDTSYGLIQAQAYINDDSVKFAGNGDFKNQVEVESVQDLLKIGTKTTLRVSFEYRDNLINTQPVDTGHIGYNVASPSAMWTFAPTQKLTITAAGRVDYLALHRSGTVEPGLEPSNISAWNRTITSFSANLGTVYKLTDVDTARATYARGIQVPSLVSFGAPQLSLGPPPFGLNFEANPGIQPTVVSNYELAYDRNIPTFGATIRAKIFYQKNTNIQALGTPIQPDSPATATSNAGLYSGNEANSDMDGFELAAGGKLNYGFHWSADTTYTNVTDKALGDYNLIAHQIDYATTTPKYRGNLAFGWADSHWSADGFIHYTTQYATYVGDGAKVVSSPSYATLGGRVAYVLPLAITAALSGQNLTTAHQIEAGPMDLRAPRRVLISLSKTW